MHQMKNNSHLLKREKKLPIIKKGDGNSHKMETKEKLKINKRNKQEKNHFPRPP